jgi:hypothetical protein
MEVMDKRIVKTGILAVAATLAFGVFAYQVAKWTDGMQSSGAASGAVTGTAQGTNVCAVSGSDTPTTQTTKIIPQLAFGSFDSGLSTYTTIIQIINISGAAQNITANFYKDDGSALDNVTLTAGESTIKNGAVASARLPEGGVMVINGGGDRSRGVLGWGRVTACGSLSIAAFYELRDARNVLVSRAAISAGIGNMSSFVIPRLREVAAGLDVAFAVVNTSETAATLKAEVIDGAGKTIAAKDIALAPRSQRTGFTKEIFTELNDPNSRIYQYVKFSSTSSSFAAIALAIQGGIQTNFPVEMLQ